MVPSAPAEPPGEPPRPVKRVDVARRGDSLALHITEAREPAALEAEQTFDVYVGPDGAVLLTRHSQAGETDPMAEGWQHFGERTVRGYRKNALYVTLSPLILSALGVEHGDGVELSASPGRLMLRAW